ncbi:uncharacterized protein LOC113354424 [Papaver somniferum]|uniref:uncharacterized protein LOC113354424 n=1 Tax=Papaver somniferum TaxID=3469 RepID=UPI000E6F8AB3|nr:uncharacterized protein LOC113354424 [Papaver somniferum]
MDIREWDRRGKKVEDAIVSDSARKQRRQNLTTSARRDMTAKSASSAQDGTQQASQEGLQPSAPQSEPVQEGVKDIPEGVILGMPEDGGQFLFGYKDSWAKEIYKTEYHSDAVRLLKPTAAPTKMLDWPLKDECERFKTIIANSGLADAAENSMLEHDRVAISTFVERLYPETDTFHMPFGEMTITPVYVVQIVRLPVHGKGVRAEFTKQLEWTKLYDLTKKCLGWDEETFTTEFKRCMKYRTRQFNIITLMDMFKGTKEKEEK